MFSESYRVNKCVKQMDIYKEFIVLNSKLNSEEMRERRVRKKGDISTYIENLIKGDLKDGRR